MGWRSWNFFQCNINQGIMQAQMDALTLRRHGTSLLRLGYEAVGLDDCWQSCTGKGGSFHDAAGQPMINTSLFPSMAAMVEHGHAQGVKVGFYQVSLPAAAAAAAAAALTLRALRQDNCRCHECQDHDHCWDVDAHYAQDANLTESLNFDGLKIDSCGNQRDMSKWAALFAQPGRHDLMVESCGNGPEGTDPKHAAYTGPDYLDIAPSWCARSLGENGLPCWAA